MYSTTDSSPLGVPDSVGMMLPSERKSNSSPRSSIERRSPRRARMTGSDFNWILDHILTYPATYEIPLRTMFTLNCAPSTQSLPRSRVYRPAPEGSCQTRQERRSRGLSPRDTPTRIDANAIAATINTDESSPISSTSSEILPTSPQQEAAHNAASVFRSNLMAEIANLPHQPCSLPPNFITSFVQRCFPKELGLVDFPQALTGMDYLRDLDIRRRREIASALRRLCIDRENLGSEGEVKSSSGKHAVEQWVRHLDEREKRVEALYTQVFIGLRRWTIINEMSLSPFNKSNCLAMLNTLYPPPPPTGYIQPTRALTPAVLSGQRQGFWRYIQAVETNGPSILDNLMLQGRRPERGDLNGWPSVREVLDRYLRLTNSMIDECNSIVGTENFAENAIGVGEGMETNRRRKGRKVDSGVSFASHDYLSTSGGSATSSARCSRDKPLPAPPVEEIALATAATAATSSLSTVLLPTTTTTITSSTPKESAFDKFARELRRFGGSKKRSDDVILAVDPRDTERRKPQPQRPVPPQILKKMKSASALGDFRERNRSLLGGVSASSFARRGSGPAPLAPSHPAFEFDDELRKRAILEAHNATAQRRKLSMAGKIKYQPLRSLEV